MNATNSKQKAIIEKAQKYLNSQSLAVVKQTVEKLYNDDRNESVTALNIALDNLMDRMEETVFIAFCEFLETL